MGNGSSGLVYKIAIVGEAGVGKTSLVKRYVYQQFSEKYLKTLGTNVYKKTIKGVGPEGKDVTLQIWDVLGQRAFGSTIKTVFKGTRGVVFVCDLTDKQSLQDLKHWLYYAYKNAKDPSFIFLGNKSDLSGRQFDEPELSKLAAVYDSKYHLVSAMTGENVEQSFSDIGQAITDGRTAPPETEAEKKKHDMDIDPVIKCEDHMISQFCGIIGGFEIGMPIIREQFDNASIDFESPKIEQLSFVLEQLVEYVRMSKGDEAAAKYEHDMKERIREC